MGGGTEEGTVLLLDSAPPSSSVSARAEMDPLPCTSSTDSPSPSCEEESKRRTWLRRDPASNSNSSPVALFLLLSFLVDSAHAAGRCFNTELGHTVAGAEYRRLRGLGHRECALECRDDFSCLAYEWGEDGVCHLKARSLNGTLEKKNGTVIGFCLDEDDEVRDRFRDHEIDGPEVAARADTEADECRQFCLGQTDASIYTWRPADEENDEAAIGTCRCLQALRAILLRFNSFSGFLPPKRLHRTQRFKFLRR